MNNKRMATPMAEDTTSFEDDQFAFMSTEDIQRTSFLLDNEISILKEELQRMYLDLDSFKEKIKLNKQFPYLLIETSSVFEVKENSFIPDYLDYDHEMILKSIDWVERLNPDSKLPNFNNGRILVHKSQTVNESLQHTIASTDTESSKDIESEPQTLVPALKALHGAFPSSEVMELIYQDHSPRERSGLGEMNHTKPETSESLNKIILGPVTHHNTEPFTYSLPTKVNTNDQESKINEVTKPVKPKPLQKPMLKYEPCHYTNHSTNDYYWILYRMKSNRGDQRTLDHYMFIASLKSSKNYKAQPYQYASPAKQILKSKAKPFLPCTHYSFDDHHPNDCRN
ncbi:hypothetical protein Tco_1231188 [Tanacetum coccineum]